jgi:hypothetical protein
MKIRIWKKAAAASIAALLAGCASLPLSRSSEETVWASREQFVSVVPAETAAGEPRNEAADLSPEQIREALAPLQVVEEGRKASPLFSDTVMLLLSEHLADGLHRAGPDRDVVFAVTGLAPTLLGLVKTPVVTTGRVFVQGGKLNLILRMVHEEVREADRRLQPFTPGSRLKPATDKLPVGSSAPLQFRPGRPDWLVLTIPAPGETVAPPKATAPPVQPKPSEVSGRAEERLRLLKDLREKGLITDEEFRAKRKDILDTL